MIVTRIWMCVMVVRGACLVAPSEHFFQGLGHVVVVEGEEEGVEADQQGDDDVEDGVGDPLEHHQLHRQPPVARGGPTALAAPLPAPGGAAPHRVHTLQLFRRV